MRRLAPLLVLLFAGCGPPRSQTIIVGSKNFTEQLVLGELIAQQLAAHTSLHIERRFFLSGTYIAQQAIRSGRIDVYVEYTGTALTAILKELPQSGAEAVFEKVRREYAERFDLIVEPPLGFDNTFAMVVRGEDARRLGLQTISEAARYAPGWRLGCGYEFLKRPDGYEGFLRAYGLSFAGPPRILDLGLLYRSLLDRQVDMVAGNSTDGQLAARDLTVLADDRHYFPPYEAVPIVRHAVLAAHPDVDRALAALAGKISGRDMQQMNYAVEGERRDPAEVVREFLRARGLVAGNP